MNHPDRSTPPRSTEPLDELDTEVLGSLRRLVTAADPVPPGLVDRIQFALALEDLDAEVMRLREEPALAGVRGAEPTRTVTFDSESLTIMISIRSSGDDIVRLDGWIAPAAPHRVELRLVGDRRVVIADEQGRFVLEGVPRGLMQMVVRNASGSPESVVTPSIVV
ncbi:hypothetical protein [Actinopolymorpha alba]|uniref:hypothetical protein n=1 Tax=Actinopolymorpha alba TaxID=533267 RepID=UPI00035D8EF0|nr:hypothetical protein [Actinopolymorpha alba]